MKIIDLLNKIANGEEIPKKIKYRDKIWEYTSTVKGRGYQYYSIPYEEWKTLQNQVYLEECLNDEAEIIEEPKKIERCKGYEDFDCMDELIEHLREKIDTLIDEVNKMKEKK